MHSDLILLKHKNPNRSQQSPPGWFSQVNWFFPALQAWKHLPAVRKAPPSKTISLAPLFPGRWPRTSYLCLNSRGVRPCNVTERETHPRSSPSKKTQLPPLSARGQWWQLTSALPPHLPRANSPCMLEAASWGRHGCWGLKEAKSEPLFTWDKWPSTATLRIRHEGLSSQHCINLQGLHPTLQPHLLLHCLLFPGRFSRFGLQHVFPSSLP